MSKPQGSSDSSAGPLLETGGRELYRILGYQTGIPWGRVAADTRAAWRAKMRELLNALECSGYEVCENAPNKDPGTRQRQAVDSTIGSSAGEGAALDAKRTPLD